MLTHPPENGHIVSDSDVASDGSGSDSSTESGECAQNHWEDPAWAAITMQQLLDLHQKAGKKNYRNLEPQTISKE